jgi:hypothetical protein
MARTPTLTNEQMEQHIALFHKEPCWWDINDADYMNINSRTAALTRIGGVVKLSVAVLRWGRGAQAPPNVGQAPPNIWATKFFSRDRKSGNN